MLSKMVAVPKKRTVHINVDSGFYDNVLEKGRKEMEKKLNRVSGFDKTLSGIDFTRMVNLNGGEINLGKFKNERFKSSKKKRKKR